MEYIYTIDNNDKLLFFNDFLNKYNFYKHSDIVAIKKSNNVIIILTYINYNNINKINSVDIGDNFIYIKKKIYKNKK